MSQLFPYCILVLDTRKGDGPRSLSSEAVRKEEAVCVWGRGGEVLGEKQPHGVEKRGSIKRK